MANVDNLNFQVILNDDDFTRKVEKDIEAAKNLNITLSALLDLKKKVGGSSGMRVSKADEMNVRRMAKMAESTDKAALAQQRLATETERTAGAAANAANAQERLKRQQMQTEQMSRRITAHTERQNRAYQSQSRILGELKGYALGYLSIHGASQLLSSLVRVTGEFELQKTTLSAMLGDLNAAEGIITRIQGLAVESPFQFKELTTYAKQLSAFSVPAQELYDTTKMLADISAGLGVGMDRIVLAYGQVRSAAFLRGQEVRQFTEAGIPILDELAKQFSELEGRAVSAGEVFDKISARLVPFEMVAKVFKDMTSEGGKFYNMQEVQAETLRGKISNLKDAYEVMLNEIGTAHQEKLKGAIDTVRRMISNYEEVGRQMLACVAIFGVTRTAIELLGVSMGKLNMKSVGIVSTFRNIAAFALKNPYVLLAAGITAAGAAMYKANDYARDYLRVQKSVTDNQEKFTKSLTAETTKLDSLYAKLKLAKKGTEEYDAAKKQIYTQYAGYISELKEEGVEVGNLAILYDQLKTKITESTRAKYRATARQDLEQRYTEGIDDAYSKFEKAVKRFEERRGSLLSEVEKEGLWQYLLGDEDVLKKNPVLHGVMNMVDQEIASGDRRIEWLKNSLRKIITEYEEGGKRIDALFGEGAEESSGYNPFDYNIPDGGGEGKSPADKIQEEIDAVKRLRDAYETLAPYMNGEMLRKTLTALFPNADQDLIRSLDFRGKLVELAAELNRFDQEASQKLLDSISGEKASEIVSAFKAIETYKNMLDSWLGEDFNLTGEGVAFDISKIIRDLNNQYAKINQKAIQANDLLTKAQMGDEKALATVREVYGEEVWQKYLVNGQAVIDELARKERESAKKTADEKIRGLADGYVNEMLKKNNIQLTDFEEKTMKQIDTLLGRLKGIRSSVQEELNKIYEGGVSDDEKARMEMLIESLKQIGIIIDDVDVEKEKKIFDNIVSGMGAISDFASELEDLGDSIENAGLSRLGRDLAESADAFASLTQALQAKDTISLISNIASLVISTVSEIAVSANNHQKNLNDAATEYYDTMSEIRREVHSGIFGTDEMALAAENMSILNEAQERYYSDLEKFAEKRFQKFGGSFWRKDSVEGALMSAANDQGWELYLEDGRLNIAALESYFDAYSSRLTKKQRDLVQSLIENGNAVTDAANQQAEYLTSLFSGVADSIADNMIDAFLETGDAVSNLEDSFTGLGESIVKSMLKSMIIDDILNDYEGRVKEIFDKSKGLTDNDMFNQLAGVFSDMSGEIEDMAGWLNPLLNHLQDLGVISDSAETGTTALGDGIKGITEDQANLLASYLNAIRADVSVSKEIWVRMDANLQRLADMLTSSPTLMEYQAQIAANTYDTSMATQALLAEIRGLVTYDSGSASLRVYREN